VGDRLRVCMVLEGSYPYITGGVSAWVQDIIQGLPDIDFVLLTISPSANQDLRYKLPPNIVEHQDIVLGQKVENRAALREKKALVDEIRSVHETMFSGQTPDLTEMIRRLPEGYALQDDVVQQQDSWDFIVKMNQKRNPVYPFSDYYWAWQSAHELIFRVLAVSPPDADIYHAISTGFAGRSAARSRFCSPSTACTTRNARSRSARPASSRATSATCGSRPTTRSAPSATRRPTG